MEQEINTERYRIISVIMGLLFSISLQLCLAFIILWFLSLQSTKDFLLSLNPFMQSLFALSILYSFLALTIKIYSTYWGF